MEMEPKDMQKQPERKQARSTGEVERAFVINLKVPSDLLLYDFS